MAKRKRKTPKKLKKELDNVCREIVVLRDNGRCQKCKKTVSGQNAHRHHIIPKSKGNALRFDLPNQILFCFHDHINWWHKNILEAQDWFKNEYPETYKYLWKHKNDIVKFTNDDLEIMLVERKEILKLLQDGELKNG